MDVLLKNGDQVLRRDGMPEMVDGIEALLQRTLIRLKTRRGSLPHDPDFGSALYTLRGTGNRKALESKALALTREALAPMPQIEINGLECTYDAVHARLTLRLKLAVCGQDARLEVCV